MAQAVRDQDRRIFEHLFGSAKQAAFAYSTRSLEILDANDAAIALFGHPRRKLIGSNLAALSTADRALPNRRTLVSADRDEMRAFRLEIRRADGGTVPLRGVESPIEYGGKRASLVIVGDLPPPARARARKRGAGETDSARLVVETRRYEALTEFARGALRGSSHAQLLQAATKLLRDTLRIDFCLAFELNPRDGALGCEAAVDWEGDVGSLRVNPAGDTLAARAYRSHEPVTVSYGANGPLPAESAGFLTRHAIVGAIGIPIRHEHTSFGSLCAYSRTERRFDDVEVCYLETVAKVIALAADRERAMGESAAAAHRISAVLESIVEHFVHVDRDWRITFVNITVPDLFSRPAEAIIGEPVTDWYPSFSDPKLRPLYEAAMQQGKPSMFEFTSSLNKRVYEARVRPTPEGIGVYYLDITERRRAEEARMEQERRTRQLLRSLPAITWLTDDRLTILTSVGGGLAKLGLKDDELAGKSLREMFPALDSPTVRAHEMALSGLPADYLDVYDGRTFNSHVEPVRDASGAVVGVAGFTVDVTDRVEADARMAEAQAIAHFGTWSFDEATGERHFSDELLRILGRTRADMPRRAVEAAALVHPDDRADVVATIAAATSANEAWNVDHRVVAPDGTTRHVQNTGRCILDADGRPASGFGSVLDITERELAGEELVRLANYDVLTGLPNRTQITARIARVIGDADQSRRCVAVACVDVDRFKSINHTLGHAGGDDVLRAVGERLRSAIRPGDLVGRLGSDEFVAIFAGVRSDADAGILAAKIRSGFAPPIPVAGRDLFITVSGGLAFYPTDGTNPEELLRHADAALYEAKDAGGDRLIAFAPAMQMGSSARLDLQTALYRALERDEFRLHYQPIVDSAQRRLDGFESLIRWHHPTLGIVPPGDFIPLAEQSGLIVPIGDWVLHAACRAALQWRPPAGAKPPWVSVNISARQFNEGGLVDSVSSSLCGSGLAADRLILELTESAVIRDLHAGAETLRVLSRMGVGVAIDDFGTGYSSLSYLRSFPFDTLKIDRSFVQGLPSSAECGSIARGIIALGHALGMRVVAEGVETEEQAAFLRSERCDKLQGYLISRPVAEDALPALIARFHE